jgi:hypothetical protein
MVLSAGDYDPAVTELCERALVTILGNAGWWGQHLYLVGGLVPRYLTVPTGQRRSAHASSSMSRQIELLLERRQALISAAVTGQLEIPGIRRMSARDRAARGPGSARDRAGSGCQRAGSGLTGSAA